MPRFDEQGIHQLAALQEVASRVREIVYPGVPDFLILGNLPKNWKFSQNWKFRKNAKFAKSELCANWFRNTLDVLRKKTDLQELGAAGAIFQLSIAIFN